jgi:hypothetical protein
MLERCLRYAKRRDWFRRMDDLRWAIKQRERKALQEVRRGRQRQLFLHTTKAMEQRM